MKKLLLLIIPILLLVGCFNQLKTYEEIDYDKFNQMINNENSFILMIGASSCSACALFKETLEDVIKDYQVKVYYIDVEAMNESNFNDFKSKYTYSGTPTTIFIENGVEKSVYNRINGAADYDMIVDMFTKNGYIKGDNNE